MGKKLLVLFFAAAIVISGIRVIQGQFKIGGGQPLTLSNIQSNIRSYIFQNLYAGANSLRTAVVELPKIPYQITYIYDQLAGKHAEIQDAIKTLQGTIGSLDGLKDDIEKNTPLSSIRDPLVASITTLQTTLPILLNVFKQLDEAIATTVDEKASQVANLQNKIFVTLSTINNQDSVFNRDLPERMDALADFLKTLNV